MLSLFKQYYDWIDDSIYDGLTEEEADALEGRIEEKYGLLHILRKDAPPEAVAAWKEDSRVTMEAKKQGLILD